MKTATKRLASNGSGHGRRAGFTLVELMVVVGIIALLVVIIVPAISNARVQAKIASSKATVSVLESGLEQYRASDRLEGTYPPSAFPAGSNGGGPSPHQLNSNAVSHRFIGANLLVWALIGADMLGTPGFRDIDNSGSWANDTGTRYNATTTALSDLYAVHQSGSLVGKPVHARQGPFVDVSKMTFPKLESGKFTAGKVSMDSLFFLDAFDHPILYYRANTTGTYLVTNTYASTPPSGVFDLRDNGLLTGAPSSTYNGVDLGAGQLSNNKYQWFATNLGDNSNPDNVVAPSFARTVWNRAAVGAIPRPHNAEKFILLTAGPDGQYGTGDDVANFPVNK